MTRKTISLLSLALAAVLFVAVNVLAGATLRHARLDLTADRLYTLSPGTVNVLAAVREPVTLRLYFSERLAGEVPALRTYGQRVRELLEEYAGRSDGRVRLEIVDPEPWSEAEERAVEAGVTGVPLDRSSGRQIYFGLVGTNSTDGQEVIPFFQQEREAFLEYDLTRLVHALAAPKRPVVGVLTAMPLEFGPGGMAAALRGGSQPYAVLSALRMLFDVRMLPPDAAAVGDDVDVLMVARPKDLPPRTLYAIDQFVMKGGRAVFFVDPWAESDLDAGPGGMPDPVTGRTAALPTLFDAWGIAMDPSTFVADPLRAIAVSTGRRTVPYPAWLSLTDEDRDRNDVVTADLGTVNVASAGSLALKEGGTATLTPLMTSSPAGQLVPVMRLLGPPEPEKLTAALGAEGSRRVLAARVSGTLASAFPDGPPKAEDAQGDAAEGGGGERPGAAEHLARSREPANLIVVADSDLLEDRFWVDDQRMLGQPTAMPFAGNGDFVVNAVENLSGSADLISLRGRAGSRRPFTLVQDLRRAANQAMLVREQELENELKETEKRIADLQGKAKTPTGALLSAEEQGAIDRFRGEVVRIRKELRAVQLTLNRDIERLAATVKAANIVAMPVAVTLLALGLAFWRARRRARLSHR
ncbi:GldG family protein [Azospirillum sp. ST 5-10]|uniref:GldG family protein n=1 Tax=unclassified Azospirillum TaxID=2630922 RepID=UPI003F49F7C9